MLPSDTRATPQSCSMNSATGPKSPAGFPTRRCRTRDRHRDRPSLAVLVLDELDRYVVMVLHGR